jgi:hypothetical protein
MMANKPFWAYVAAGMAAFGGGILLGIWIGILIS